MGRAIFYLTFNGVFNNTNGIGTQTKTLLLAISHFYDYLEKEFGKFALHIISPSCNLNSLGFSNKDIVLARKITQMTGGDVHFCPYQTNLNDFWTVANWQTLSIAGADRVLSLAKYYSESLVVAIDPPFLQTPLLIERTKKDLGLDIKSLIALYGTSYIHDKANIDFQRLSWEYQGIASARLYDDIKIGKICQTMEDHLITYFGADRDKFIPFESSLFLENKDFKKLSKSQIKNVLEKYDLPVDKEIILAFGRADWIKGFDILLKNLTTLIKKIHLVLVVVPYYQNDSILDTYKNLIKTYQIDATFIVGYNREIPKTLCQLPFTKIVVCPSRGEPFSNIPLEVSLWAKTDGPVVLTSNIDGFNEQITDGFNGFIFDINEPHSLENKLNYILNLPDDYLSQVRYNAFKKVMAERDFLKNFVATLANFWKS